MRLGIFVRLGPFLVLNDLIDEQLLFRVSGRLYCQQVELLTRLTGYTLANARVMWPAVYQLHDRWKPQMTDLLAEVSAEVQRLSGNQ